MKSYVVLLRAVNVGGNNKIKMSDLKQQLLNANFTNVKTYIQSGNIILSTNLDEQHIINKISKIIQDHFSLAISVFVITINDLKTAINNNPFATINDTKNIYFTFFNDNISIEKQLDLKQIDIKNEKWQIVNNILYYYLPEGMSNSKLTNSFIEKKWKVLSTGRNLNTILKLNDLINSE